ncbi:MAG: ACP S-malonyltransferase [Oscillospiraceae bacterium]
MKKVAYVFPGQGSQWAGMGKKLYDNFTSAKKVFDEADRILGFPMTQVCFDGPEEKLTQTANAQPALVITSIACLAAAQEVLKDRLPKPAFVAGHSLGEYTALIAANCIDFASCVTLARKRGLFMEEAGEVSQGTMAAIIGLKEDQVQKICRETGVWIANYNAPGQIVISGYSENVATASTLARDNGAKLVVPLQVSGAFHSPLMKLAADNLAKAISSTAIQTPVVSIIGNTHAQLIDTDIGVRMELLEQLCSSVQWTRIVKYLFHEGVDTFIEIGPGEVLSGLIRRICPDAKVININDEMFEEDIFEAFP